MKTAQLKENKDILDKVTGDVKLTRNETIPALDTIQVSGVTRINAHSKRVNIVTEPRKDLDEYTIPSYSYMRPGSKRAGVTLLNLSNKPVVLKKGTVIAMVKAGNKIPPMLAPKLHNEKELAKDKLPGVIPQYSCDFSANGKMW